MDTHKEGKKGRRKAPYKVRVRGGVVECWNSGRYVGCIAVSRLVMAMGRGECDNIGRVGVANE